MGSTTKRIFEGAWRDFRRTWPALLTTSLIYKAIAFAILTPFTALLLRALVSTSGDSVVADEQILFFLLSPVGMAGLVVFATVSLAIIALQQACLMMIAFGAAHDRRVRPRASLLYVKTRWRAVLSLAGRVAVRALVTALPFLAVGGVLYLWLLTEFDINFYLSQRPREFFVAVALIGPVVVALVVTLVYRGLAWLVALPVLMFEQTSPSGALVEAGARVKGRRREAAAVLVGWGLGAIALSSATTALISWGGRLVLPRFVGSPTGLLLVVSLLMVAWFFGGQLVTFVNGAGFALLVTQLYRQDQGPTVIPREWKSELDRLDDGAQASIPRWTLVGGLAAAVMIGLVAALLAVQGLEGDSDVEITAHRGASMFAPENSLAAVQRALEDRTDWVEIDVQESADGRVVVVHDSDFMKLAGVPTKVWDATYADIERIDIGSSFAPEFADQRTPTLEQVLELARGRAGVNIELKYYGHGEMLEQRVVDIVEALSMVDQIVVMSLKADAVRKMRSLRPGWTLGLLTAVAIGDLTRADADFLAVSAGLATPSFVRSAHRAGKEVLVWTVNDPFTAYAMISRGVDGIITDDPAMGRQVRNAFNELTGIERLALEFAILVGMFEIDDDEPDEVG